jgi:hypothetical protein
MPGVERLTASAVALDKHTTTCRPQRLCILLSLPLVHCPQTSQQHNKQLANSPAHITSAPSIACDRGRLITAVPCCRSCRSSRRHHSCPCRPPSIPCASLLCCRTRVTIAGTCRCCCFVVVWSDESAVPVSCCCLQDVQLVLPAQPVHAGHLHTSKPHTV